MEQNEIISSGLLELYVLGMASEQETARVLAMAKQYHEVNDEIVSIESCLEHYAHVHAVNPSIRLKEKVFTEINADNEPKAATIPEHEPAKAVGASSFWKYAAAASIILFIGTSILSVNYYRKYENVHNELVTVSKERSAIEQQFVAQQQLNEEMQNDMQIVQSKYSEAHNLNGLPTAPEAAAKIFWMKNTNEVYIDASNLPDAPQGMQYQFWGIVDGKPVDGGMIIMTKKEDKYRIQKMKSFGRAEAFAVTLETAGGNPQPKGTMYVMGKM